MLLPTIVVAQDAHRITDVLTLTCKKLVNPWKSEWLNVLRTCVSNSFRVGFVDNKNTTKSAVFKRLSRVLKPRDGAIAAE